MEEEDTLSYTPQYSFQNIDTGQVTDFVDEDAPQQRCGGGGGGATHDAAEFPVLCLAGALDYARR